MIIVAASGDSVSDASTAGAAEHRAEQTREPPASWQVPPFVAYKATLEQRVLGGGTTIGS